MAKVISFINQKGGVGKTTSANAIAVCLRHRGCRVLCVDFDPQGCLSFSAGVDMRDQSTVYDVLKRTVKAQYAVVKTPVADMIPANGMLAAAEREFTGPGCERILADCLRPVAAQYDYIIIDAPPEPGLLSANALVASDVVLIPALPDGYSLQGVIQLMETVNRFKHAFRPDLVVGGLFLVRYYPREALSRTAKETALLLAAQLRIPFLHTQIRHSNVLPKAMSTLQCDLLAYAPKNHAVCDYLALVDELFQAGVL